MNGYNADVEVFGTDTECKCPKCGKKHIRKLNWKGRGVPRFFCGACAAVVEKHESAQLGKIAGISASLGWSLKLVTR